MAKRISLPKNSMTLYLDQRIVDVISDNNPFSATAKRFRLNQEIKKYYGNKI